MTLNWKSGKLLGDCKTSGTGIRLVSWVSKRLKALSGARNPRFGIFAGSGTKKGVFFVTPAEAELYINFPREDIGAPGANIPSALSPAHG